MLELIFLFLTFIAGITCFACIETIMILHCYAYFLQQLYWDGVNGRWETLNDNAKASVVVFEMYSYCTCIIAIPVIAIWALYIRFFV